MGAFPAEAGDVRERLVGELCDVGEGDGDEEVRPEDEMVIVIGDRGVRREDPLDEVFGPGDGSRGVSRGEPSACAVEYFAGSLSGDLDRTSVCGRVSFVTVLARSRDLALFVSVLIPGACSDRRRRERPSSCISSSARGEGC